ncbi:MAG: D-aspartate ligase [Bacillales bacterium]|jgi:predicted ATP-grasp superfamily ATP-dependent carboligase|nr:D-aspartate ligase [Bacillales bacterium]
MKRAFVTDGLLRKSLSATRSLGKKGINTIVGEKSIISPSGFSKYCNKRLKYPDPQYYPEQFLQWLKENIDNNTVLIPMDDTILKLLIENRKFIKNYKCILPSKEAYNTACDKFETIKLSMKQNIDCPKSYLPKDNLDLLQIADIITYPAIIKPRISSGSRGIRKAENKEQLITIFNKVKNIYNIPLIQEFVPTGDRYDVCLVYDCNSEIKATFVQKEIRHFPIEMGPSTVQESVKYDELIERSVRLLQPLKWTGIVEVEYMVDPRNNEPKLMEINPRFWNSLDLAVRVGVDFPYLYYKLCMDENVELMTDYKVGIKSRWSIPGDILHFILNRQRFKMVPSFFAGKKHQVYDDTFSKNDPLPGIIFLLACVKFMLSLDSLKMFFRR